jgi:hypothetical protein
MRKKPKRSTLRIWWHSVVGRSVTISASTVVALLGLAYTYKTNGAEELRAQVYRPLFSDLGIIKTFVLSLSSEQGPYLKSLPDLQKTGAFEQAPREVRDQFTRLADDASVLNAAVLSVRETVVREMSARIMVLRSEAFDIDWRQRTLRALNVPGRGVSDSVSFQLSHEARSPALDLRTRSNQPQISDPGGPTFVVRDWVTYPGSLTTIDRLWTDQNFLYFNDRKDGWYYQITREDLHRANIDLKQMLHPVYDILLRDPQFQLLQNLWPAAQRDVAPLEAALTTRIRDPKLLRDLLSW